MMEKNSRQDHGSLGAHIAGQAAKCVPALDRFSGRFWNWDICAGLHPGNYSLAEQNDEPKAAAGSSLTEHVVSQLFVASHPIFSGHGLGQRIVHRGFF
jgi:hypothetical protein